MTAQSTTKKRPNLLIGLAVIGGICMCCIVVSAAMNAMGLVPTSTPSLLPSATLSPSETPLPSETLLPAATLPPIDQLKLDIETSLGDGNRDVPRLTEFNWSGLSLIIEWAINDSMTAHLTFVGSQIDITAMLKVISQSGLLPENGFVTFVGTFPLRDAFGNVTEERVVTASYNKSTIDKINWENFLHKDIFVISDFHTIHPAMTE